MKALVFTSFTSFLDLMEDVLRRSDSLSDKYLRLDGTMRLAERAAALQQFQADPNKKIFLLSMKAVCFAACPLLCVLICLSAWCRCRL